MVALPPAHNSHVHSLDGMWKAAYRSTLRSLRFLRVLALRPRSHRLGYCTLRDAFATGASSCRTFPVTHTSSQRKSMLAALHIAVQPVLVRQNTCT